MINETFTHFINEVTTNVVSSAYATDPLSWFQILLISVGLLSLTQTVILSAFRQGILGVFYFIGVIKWVYMKLQGRDI